MERIKGDFNSKTGFAIKNHIKKGGYHNSEVFYDDYLVSVVIRHLNKLINSVDEDEKDRKIVPTLGGNQEVWFNCKIDFTVEFTLKKE